MLDQLQQTRGQLSPLPAEQGVRLPSRNWWLRLAFGLAVLGVVCGAWILATDDNCRSFLMVSPEAVWKELGDSLADGSLLRHLAVTAIEVALGFVIGVGSAFLFGYGIAKSKLLEQTIGPYLIALQAVPIIAIAPALIIYF